MFEGKSCSHGRSFTINPSEERDKQVSTLNVRMSPFHGVKNRREEIEETEH